MHLKFTDTSGKTISPWVQIESWRGSEALYNIRHPNVLETKIPNKCKESGEYVWDWAPGDAVNYTVSVGEWSFSKKLELVANNTEQTIVLTPPPALNGTVVDHKTGQPVSGFDITPVTFDSSNSNERGIAQSSRTKPFDSPTFSMNGLFGNGDWKRIALRFTKPGYEVFTTPAISASENNQPMTIRMVPTPVRTGRVLKEDGQPAENLRAWLVPDFAFRKMDGTVSRISEMRGKRIVLDFWATWCKPCINGLPDVEALHAHLRGMPDTELLSISLDESLQTVRDFVAERKLPWPQGVLGQADGGANAETLGVSSVPLWIVIDEQGQIELRTHDPSELKKHLGVTDK